MCPHSDLLGWAEGTRRSSVSPAWPSLAALPPAPGAWHLRSRGSSRQQKGGADLEMWEVWKGSCRHWFSVEKFSVSSIILRRKVLFSTESHLSENWKIFSPVSSFFEYENSLQESSLEITGGFFDSDRFYLLVLGGRRNRRTTSRKTSSLLVCTGASFCPKTGCALLTVEDATFACWFRPWSSGEAEVPR